VFGITVNIVQIVLSIALVVAIILQSKGAGLGGLTGGSEGGGVFRARRGVEKLLFNITIGLSIAFFITAIVNVVVTNQQ
jgi:preprotein translocase subunit SecG